MSKYMVLFTPESVDPTDDSFTGIFTKLLFGYPDPASGWIYDSAGDAVKGAVREGYVPEKDFIVVRVMSTRRLPKS